MKNPFKIPREPKGVFVWIIKQMLLHLGCGGALGFAALIIVALSIFGFLVGDYTSVGSGDVSGNNVSLGPQTSDEDKALLTHYEEVGAGWQKGLSQDQISQVQQQQVDLPGAVLLGIGKMENNMNPPNAEEYYKYLAPTYTWKTYIDVTIHYWTVQTKTGPVTMSQETDTPVSILQTATTWDGTLTDSYKWVETMQGTRQSGVYTKKIVLDPTKSKRIYDWSKVWNLFSNILAGEPGRTFIIKNSQMDQDTLAGLIAAVDYTITDPTVQKMVSVDLFPGGTSGLGSFGPVAKPDGKAIDDVVRWKSYIEAASKKYQVPAVLIAGVMYQESNGLQTNANGSLVISSAGAVGLMQVEPSTAAGMTLNGLPIGSTAMADLSNPELNIAIGSMYLSELYHEFNEIPEEAESAYNAGPGAEQEALAKGEQIAQNSQTIEYVRNIQGSWIPALEKYFGPLPNTGNSNNVSGSNQPAGGIGK